MNVKKEMGGGTPKKRILFYLDSLIMGGAEKIGIDYLNLLNEIRKYDIFLVINENNGERGNVLIERIPKNIKYQFIIKEKTMERLNYYKEKRKKNSFYKIIYTFYRKKKRFERRKIKEVLKEQQYDILIDFQGRIPLELLNDKIFMWQHLNLGQVKSIEKFKENLKRIRKRIVLNEDMKKEIEKVAPELVENKVKVIPNFFDIDYLKKLSMDYSKLTLKEKELIKENYFFACCRIDRQKDLDTLIESYKILKEQYHIKEKLYIAGIGDEKERLESLVKNYNLENEIVFLGLQLNPYVWMKNAKFFIHSSHYEGFGLVLVEALITNGMVISSNCPVGPREILEDGKVGILFPVGDKEKLVEEILKVLTNEDLVEKYREEAQRKIEEFSKERVKKEIIELLDEI